MNQIELGIFASRMAAVCDEMGVVLQRAAFSPNIKDRLDFSCAVFTPDGELCAQAAHIPVHLGSMAFAMADLVAGFNWQPKQMMVLNDPYKGGTHLPDVTVIAPVYNRDELIAFVVNRAHHANIGAHSPGSMPISSDLSQEGVVISPTLIVENDAVQWPVLAEVCGLDAAQQKALSQQGLDAEPSPALGDFMAQISANRIGRERVLALVSSYGKKQDANGSISANGFFSEGLVQLNDYAERLARAYYATIPAGTYEFSDVMDSDGQGNEAIVIKVSIRIEQDDIFVDFNGTEDQVDGNINCPLSVAAAAVYYVFRCLLPAGAPSSAGCFRPIHLQAKEGCMVHARYPAAVAAGNVETSTRIVDVVLGAMAQALPERIPAASQGSMNNVAMGSSVAVGEYGAWDYYETIAGGMGAGPGTQGLHGVHSHMTNTLNTPIESLEMHYPLRIKQYALRQGSGGEGCFPGGDGLIKEIEFLAPAELTLLCERRRSRPYGLNGGGAGQTGFDWLNQKPLHEKQHTHVNTGDVLLMRTPGGGAWGDRSDGSD